MTMTTRTARSNIYKYTFIITASLISIFPLYFMFVSCFNSNVEIVQGFLYPSTHLLENLRKLGGTYFWRSFLNSVKYTAVGTLLTVFVCSLAGYGFEVYNDKLKDKVMFLFLLSIMVPIAVILVPMFMLYVNLGLLNSTFGFVMPFISTAIMVLLFRQSARSFPRELIDAARIDGLGELQIYFSMFIPIMKSTFACGIILSIMFLWNDYLWGLVVLQNPDAQIIQVYLSSLNDGYSIDYGLMMTAVTMSTLPIALVFFLLQKTFIESISGSSK